MDMNIKNSITDIEMNGETFRRTFQQGAGRQYITWEKLDREEDVIKSWNVDVDDLVLFDLGKALEKIYQMTIRIEKPKPAWGDTKWD